MEAGAYGWALNEEIVLASSADEPTEATSMDNLFSNIPVDLPDELLETRLDAGPMRIERIVSRGHTSPEHFWYDQEQHEWVVVLRGAARLRFEEPDELLEMGPGDFVHIPAHRRHRVDWTAPGQPTIWLAVHYPAE